MTSSRLPGKVLLPGGERTMLAHHVDRLRDAEAPIIVATTTNLTDEPIVDAADQLGVASFRGSESDVLARFAGAADESGLDVIVRVTSDCPLIDGHLIREGVDRFLEYDDPDAYVSNTLERSYPRGFDFEVFSASALREAHERATDAVDREHVTPYIHSNRSGRVNRVSVTRSPDASRFRVTLDTEDDYAVLRRLIEEHDAASLGVDAIIDVLQRNPDLVALNAHVEQKKLGE